jgi:hypothetical protein
MFDTKNKVGRWGIVLISEALIDEYAARMLANVRRGPQAEEEAQHVHLTHVPIPRPHHEHFTWASPLVTQVIKNCPVDWIHVILSRKDTRMSSSQQNR